MRKKIKKYLCAQGAPNKFHGVLASAGWMFRPEGGTEFFSDLARKRTRPAKIDTETEITLEKVEGLIFDAFNECYSEYNNYFLLNDIDDGDFYVEIEVKVGLLRPIYWGWV